MWGKKKSEAQERAEYARFTEGMLRQVVDDLATRGINPDAILATDGMLHSYWGSGVNWRSVWDFASVRCQQDQIAQEQIADLLSLPKYNIGPPDFGSAPYWAPDRDEPGGARPLSILAFVPVRFRGPLGSNPNTDSEVLKMLAHDSYTPGANAARQQLIDRKAI